MKRLLIATLLCLPLAACSNETNTGTGSTGGNPSTTGGGNPTATDGVDPEKFLLKADPGADTMDVALARHAEPGTGMILVGRIGGRETGVVHDKRLMFMIADVSLNYCGQVTDEKSNMPWRYCCTPKEELTAGIMPVNFVQEGESRAPLFRGKLPWRPLDIVKVVGKIGRVGDDPVFLATGIFIVERPKFAHKIDWPAVCADRSNP